MPDSGVRLTECWWRCRWPPTSGSASRPSTCCGRRGSACASASGWASTPPSWPTLYDVSILTYVGCPVYGNEAATLFGDDIDFRADAVEVDLAGFPAMMFMLRRAGSGTSAFNRARQAAGLMATGGRAVVEQMANHCSAAGVLADGWAWAPRCGPASSSPTPGGTARACPATWPATRSPSRRGSPRSRRRARSSTARPGSTRRWTMVRSRSGTHFDPADRGRGLQPTRRRCSTASTRTPSTWSSTPSRSSGRR